MSDTPVLKVVGIPPGGTAGQVLSKIDGADYNTEWSTPTAGDLLWDGDLAGGISNQNTGNVGIGVANPSYTLDVNEGTIRTRNIRFQNADAPAGQVAATMQVTSSGSFRINQVGTLGTNLAYQVDSRATGGVGIHRWYTGEDSLVTEAMRINLNGELSVPVLADAEVLSADVNGKIVVATQIDGGVI